MKFKISETMYRTSVTIYFDDDRFWVDTDTPISRKEECKGMFYVDQDTNASAIWIKSQENKIDTLGAISHEITHLTHEASRWLGIGCCEDSEEFFTYYHQYFLERVVKRMKLFHKK